MARGSSFAYHLLYLCIGFLYPLYRSLIAIETPANDDDSIWLVYWIIFAIFNILEFGTDYTISWLPFYSALKIVFLVWCVLPIPHNGAYYLFKVVVEPFYMRYGDKVIPVVNEVFDKTSNLIPPYPERY